MRTNKKTNGIEAQTESAGADSVQRRVRVLAERWKIKRDEIFQIEQHLQQRGQSSAAFEQTQKLQLMNAFINDLESL